MKRTLKTILFAGTFVLILALIGYIAIKISQDRLSGEQGASAEYAILRNTVSPITSEQELGDQFVRDRLKSLYGASAHLLAVQVLDRNGLVLWKMPDESPYFASPASNPGSVFRAPGMSTVIYMTPLPDGMKLMALYATLTQANISRILLLPIIILALWIILLVVLQLTMKEKPEMEPAPAEYKPEEVPQPAIAEEQPASQEKALQERPSEDLLQEEVEPSQAEEMPLHPQQEESIEPAPAPFPEPPEPSQFEPAVEPVTAIEPMMEQGPAKEPKISSKEQESEPIAEPQAEAGQTAMPSPPAAAQPVRTEAAHPTEMNETPAILSPENLEEEGEFVSPPPQEEPPTQSRELFPSTITSHSLEQALAMELSRNQDIALMLILCELLGDIDPSALALGVTIRDYFATDSLVFELGRGCYAAVLPGSDAGAGLKLAVDLDDVLTTTASLYKDLADEPPFYFGISGRYERAIDPERFYKEAYAALRHAHESGSRILAFKPAAPMS